MYCKCGIQIPEARLKLGHNTCVQCSTTEKVAAIDIVYHKTGNCIEVTDKETAEKVNKLSKRSSFGTMSCLKGSKTNTYNPKNIKHGAALTTIGSQEAYEKLGEKCMMLYEGIGYAEAIKELDLAVSNFDINKVQANKIRQILDALENAKVIEKPKDPLRYHNLNIKEEKHVDEEISMAFINWKRH